MRKVGQTEPKNLEQAAFARAASALKELEKRGVDAVVTGSLAARRFGRGSDVDFLVRACPEHLRYALEAAVEDIMLEIPFDLVYRDEIPVRVAERMAKTAATSDELTFAARD